MVWLVGVLLLHCILTYHVNVYSLLCCGAMHVRMCEQEAGSTWQAAITPCLCSTTSCLKLAHTCAQRGS